MKKSPQFKLFVYITITVIVIVLLFPFFVTLSTAFKDLEEVYSSPPHWIPKRLAWENFEHIWQKYPLAQYFPPRDSAGRVTRHPSPRVSSHLPSPSVG